MLTPTSGSEVCVGLGRTLRLDFGQGNNSAHATGTALTQISPGVFRGARAGSAELSGQRRLCPTAKPGEVACDGIAGWRVTVRVR